ncbi:T9SS type A sorting domain-containing protein [Chryseobacterium daeguense]|uniref:T9SS type A sorting domain-containing protein n=1 Tax=Chryseobacterium daeguense TaxID=412438 RepID=UPI0009D645CD|nr:T9SS type A sorting domain-containing protein [Chryseobacterium daeguense]
MRKALLFVFLSSCMWAQNTSELFNTSWYISKMTINGQTITTPAMDITVQPSTFALVSNNYVFNSKYFNIAGIPITFSTVSDAFMKSSSGGCTIADYFGSNMTAVQGYDQKNCDFYVNPSVGNAFSYEIVANGTGKTLIITNIANGNKVYYNSFILETKENQNKKSPVFFPNPAKDTFTVENIENDLSVKVFDMSGSLVYEGKSSDKKVKINTKNFLPGQYILILKGHNSYKFIKK